MHYLAARPGLMRDQTLAQQVLGRVPDLLVVATDLDAAGLTAATGMDLGLDYPFFTTDFLGAVNRLFGAVGEPAGGNGDTEPLQ